MSRHPGGPVCFSSCPSAEPVVYSATETRMGRGRDDRWDDHQRETGERQEVASTKSKQPSAFGTIPVCPGTTPRVSPAGRRTSERQDQTRRPAIQNPTWAFVENKTAKGNRNGFLEKKVTGTVTTRPKKRNNADPLWIPFQCVGENEISRRLHELFLCHSQVT